MRICLVSREYPPETAHGGIGTQTYLRAHGLSALGHEVVVVSASIDRNSHDYFDSTVRVLRLPGYWCRVSTLSEPVDWITHSGEVAAAVDALHRESELDLVNFPEWGSEGFIHLLNRNEHNLVPTVVHIHGPLAMIASTTGWPALDSEHYRVGTFMEGTCLQLADALSSSSKHSADWCRTHYGIRSKPIALLHAGVDLDRFQFHANPAGPPSIIFSGQVKPEKGVSLLAEATLNLVDDFPDLQVHIVGKGQQQYVDELCQKLERRGKPNLLTFHGFVGHDRLAELLANTHIFAGPSKHEPGPGTVYLEAMASGCAVVATRGAGAAEVVQDGQTGILIPPDNAEALAEALRRLLNDATTRKQYAEAGRRYVERQWDTQICVKRIASFYATVAAEHGRKASH